MIQLDYQNPLHVERRKRMARWWPYFGGAIGGLVTSLLIWIIVVDLWPAGHWRILDFPDIDPCVVVGSVFTLAFSASTYWPIASPWQTVDRHILHGVVAGLFLVTASNFAARTAGSYSAESFLLGIVCLLSIPATPVLLGMLSRHDAKKQEQADKIT